MKRNDIETAREFFIDYTNNIGRPEYDSDVLKMLVSYVQYITTPDGEGGKSEEEKHPMKNLPEKIYLVFGLNNDEIIDEEIDFDSLHDVTWCTDKQDEGDAEYIRADLFTAAQQRQEVSQWIGVDIKPSHNQQVLTYAPKNDITDEEFRLIRFGSQLSGFPHGVTHWQPLPTPPQDKTK